MVMRYGYPVELWDKAKEEMRQVLIERAKCENTISYSEVTDQG